MAGRDNLARVLGRAADTGVIRLALSPLRRRWMADDKRYGPGAAVSTNEDFVACWSARYDGRGAMRGALWGNAQGAPNPCTDAPSPVSSSGAAIAAAAERPRRHGGGGGNRSAAVEVAVVHMSRLKRLPYLARLDLRSVRCATAAQKGGVAPMVDATCVCARATCFASAARACSAPRPSPSRRGACGCREPRARTTPPGTTAVRAACRANSRPARCQSCHDPARARCVSSTPADGLGCDGYEAEGHCVDGRLARGHEWAGGAGFDVPETQCCACGRAPAQSPRHAHAHVWASGLLPAGEMVTVPSEAVSLHLSALERRDAAARCALSSRGRAVRKGGTSGCERLAAAAEGGERLPCVASAATPLAGALGATAC